MVERERSPKAEEHRRAASLAGLDYVTDGVAGISRRRAGSGWSFSYPDGTRISDRNERRRITSLTIPPAWTEVWICPSPRGHIQVTARDTKGRKQYLYHSEYRSVRDQSKFRRIFEFGEALPAVRETAERDLLAPELSRRQVLATAVQLLDKTLIRVGNDEYAADNRSYGLTTLRDKHVKIRGSEVRFSFQGKSGVQHALSVRDGRIARIVQRCRDIPGQDLFQYLDDSGKRESIGSSDVNGYLREVSGRQITAKDFRTWGGTMLAGVKLREIGPASSEREIARNVNIAVDAVAERLGNTRAVCRRYYIHPALIQAYNNSLVPGPPVGPPSEADGRGNRGAALRRDEVAVLQFLSGLV